MIPAAPLGAAAAPEAAVATTIPGPIAPGAVASNGAFNLPSGFAWPSLTPLVKSPGVAGANFAGPASFGASVAPPAACFGWLSSSPIV